ncbi:TonB-dependent receptor [Chitinimonas arctica]|uniref:TonB-dependent receptor n=1 Tax=Chitinimonas arctica TaxID=2594795 RepID=A0A516SI81_9NEIS|nr:TonB-dependent receptor [Chitinimonas arctica]QDQ27867.1 TonB-dependent receptor [Chitinimonas arctica]
MRMKQLAYAISLMGIAGMTHVYADDQPQKAEKIEITGSSIKRIAKEGALPVTTVTKEEIARSGATTAAEVISNISANGIGGLSDAQAVGTGASYASASLRGLGENSTLVLVNGRRMTSYAIRGGGVDLNSIPLAAIERIEVLKDGASAIYGSDAVAGVINFVLKKNFQGGEATATYGKATQGGGGLGRFNAVAGFGEPSRDGYNVFVTYDYAKIDRMKATDRDFSKTADLRHIGFIDKRSFASFPGNYSSDEDGNFATDRSNGGAANYAPSPNCPEGQLRGGLCRYDYVQDIDTIPKSEKHNLFARFTMNLNEQTQLFAEAMYSQDESDNFTAATPVRTDQIPRPFAEQTAYMVPATNPYNPTFGTANPIDLMIAGRTVELGGRHNGYKNTANRFLVGVKGNLGQWDYDTSIGRSEGKGIEKLISGWVSEPKIREGMANGWFSPAERTRNAADHDRLVAAQLVGDSRVSKRSVTWADFKVSTAFEGLLAEPIGFAIGGEFRKEKMDDVPNDWYQTGIIIGGSGTILPVHASRDVKSLFTELNVPFTKTIEMQLAARYDNYGDFNNTAPKIGLRWQPVNSLLLRGSYGKGFRAPNLDDLNQQREIGTQGNFDDPLRCIVTPTGYDNTANGFDCANQFSAWATGNKNLKPEESTQSSLGFVFEPSRNLSIGATWWQVEVKHAINQYGFDALIADPDLTAKYIVRNPLSAADAANGLTVGAIDHYDFSSQNLGGTKTAGVDLDLAYRFRMAAVGNVKLGFNGTYYTKQDVKLNPAGKYEDANGSYFNTLPYGRWKASTSASFDHGAWSETFIVNSAAGYTDADPAHTVSSYTTLDMQLTYAGLKNAKFTFGLKNAFNRKPPLTNQGDLFAVGWDTRTVGDARGRFAYGSLNYKFW